MVYEQNTMESIGGCYRSSRILYAIFFSPWRGNSYIYLPAKLAFTLVLRTPCLPFSGFALRPRGHTPLEPPTAFLQTLLTLSAVL
jgi:hypothetical protein